MSAAPSNGSTPETLNLVIVSAGAGDPSSTQMLADRLAAQTVNLAHERGLTVAVSVIELRTLANEIAAALVSQINGPGLTAAIEKLAAADGIVAATPIYKAGVSGLFKSFFDLLDNDLLIAKPIAPAATAGTARHALVVDEASARSSPTCAPSPSRPPSSPPPRTGPTPPSKSASTALPWSSSS